jgi:hypothetical protein
MRGMSPAVAFLWNELLAPTLNAFALTGSLIGLVIGVGLLVATDSTLQFFRRMNRRVSMRQAAKPLEVPRDIEGGPGHRHHPVVAIAFMLGGAYAAFILFTQLSAARTVKELGITHNPVTAEVLVDAARWFLIVGGLAAVALGALMLVRPHAWVALEARANQWKSTRQMMRGGEEPHDLLDRVVERFPRPAGAVLTVASLVASAAFAILLFR